MRQYLLDASFTGEQKNLILTDKENQYLTKVLRLKVGERLLGRDRTGKTWLLELEQIGKNSCILSVSPLGEDEVDVATDALPSYKGGYPRIFLYQCLCKGKKNETIVRQATEIGVEEITLVQSKFCVKEYSYKKGKGLGPQKDRLEAQIKEAIQQSGSPIPTHLTDDVIDLADIPRHWDDKGPFIFFHQSTRGEQQSLPQLLATVESDTPIAMLIGSEGGLSDDECTFLEDAGYKPVMLKGNILRAETAAIYALSTIQVLLAETQK
ncbi:MAG: 16S rRNA (uracil(1498)-N(3))-methyltransferase [Spirochaetia bacterium]|jgi:16S rRNA (uracil1498-N3)-methyltransferase|nr:16S rRNA (uracil(1498)-N(3))-methyltransferase [Spirochaetia bacterium]